VQSVFEAIRALDEESQERHPKIWRSQVTPRLGRAGSADTANAIAWLAHQGHIEVIYEIEEGPVAFRAT
jgi:hypothetical protein